VVGRSPAFLERNRTDCRFTNQVALRPSLSWRMRHRSFLIGHLEGRIVSLIPELTGRSGLEYPYAGLMRFTFVDRILELDAGRRIVAVKAVTLGEEYLADHFPTFPVLPGVLMLQVLIEAGEWLVRESLGFTVGPILLREVKNLTFKSFVKPGSLLTVEVQARGITAAGSELEGVGRCGEVDVIRGRFGLRHGVLPGGAGENPTEIARALERERNALAYLRR